MTSDLRVLIVADDPLARAGLAALLAEQGSQVVGRAAVADDLPAAIALYYPDVVLWDAGWEATGLERLSELRDRGVAVVTLLATDSHVQRAWAAGARGMLERSSSPEQLAAALAAVAEGLVVFAPAFADAWADLSALAAARAWSAEEPLLGEELTPRELQVLRLLAEGLPNKAIAARLNISEHTVKFHVNAVLGKLGAQSRTEAVVRATRLGLILL